MTCVQLLSAYLQANAILERIHQVIERLVRTLDLQNNCIDEDDPLVMYSRAATAFVVRSIYHDTLQPRLDN